jgi:hypothetical protein
MAQILVLQAPAGAARFVLDSAGTGDMSWAVMRRGLSSSHVQARQWISAAMTSSLLFRWAAAAALPFVAAASAAEPASAVRPEARPVQYAQLVVSERIMIRTTRLREALPADPPQTKWKEKHGPKCVQAKAIAGAALISQNSVDLILRDNRRLRAKLERSCPALDYYYGFYITPNPDGRVCADRDVIRSRMGGACQIDRFRLLKLARD